MPDRFNWMWSRRKVIFQCSLVNVWVSHTSKWQSYVNNRIVYTRKNLTTCSKSANKPSPSCVRTACYKLSTSLNKLLTTCNNLVDIIRLVTRLFQQGCYNHDITILLRPCVVNLVTFLLYHDCIKLVRTTL